MGCSPRHIVSLGYSPPSRCSKCNARVMTARPPMAMPEELQADRVRLRRHRVSDASGIAEAVTSV